MRTRGLPHLMTGVAWCLAGGLSVCIAAPSGEANREASVLRTQVFDGQTPYGYEMPPP